MRRIILRTVLQWALFFTSMIFAVLCHAQDRRLRFEHITSQNGLAQNTITSVTKDKYGFIWVGTVYGLCRYDGYRFKLYKHKANDRKSIINNKIMNFYLDGQKSLWVNTFDTTTICRYNYEKDDFDQIPVANIPPITVARIREGNRPPAGIFRSGNTTWHKDPRNNALIQTYLPNGNRTYYTSASEDPWALNESYISTIFLDNEKILWVGTYNNGLNKADLNAKPFHYAYTGKKGFNSVSDNSISAFCEDNKHVLWVGTRFNGIMVVKGGRSLHQYRNFPPDSNTLVDDNVRALLDVKNGDVWVGTKKGLDRFDHVTGKFVHYRQLGLGRSPVYACMKDHAGDVWFGTWNGIFKHIDQTNEFIRLPFQLKRSQRIKALIEDVHHRIWVGTEGGGISVFRSNGRYAPVAVSNFIHNDGDPSSLCDDRVACLYQDRSENIWIGTSNGLDRYDLKKQKITHVEVSPEALADGAIAAITQDDKGFIWVSHKRGLSRIDPVTMSTINYSHLDGLHSYEFMDGAVLKSRFNRQLYFGGNNGYNYFTPDSIHAHRTFPRVYITDLHILNKLVRIGDTVNGRVVLTKALCLTKNIDLTYHDKSIEIEFAGLHFANPNSNKYAYMLEGFDKEWIYTSAERRVASYSNLPPGKYNFKVRASNSDGVWNPVPAVLQVTVSPPFWASTPAYIIYLLMTSAILFIFYLYTIKVTKLKSKLRFEEIIHQKENELHENKLSFFTNISHEIKTPLSLILAPIEKLLSPSISPEMVKDQLVVMKKNGDRLLSLINQLLDIRRFETGNEPLVGIKTDLVAFIAQMVLPFRVLSRERSITLEFDSDRPFIEWVFDEDKIEKIIANLLSNAFKFTPAGGQIMVRIKLRDHGASRNVILEVLDSGAGIDPSEYRDIFLPFNQGRTKKSSGTGLGLAYVKSLVELHGGTIRVESIQGINPDYHTCFMVSLPELAFHLEENTNRPSMGAKIGSFNITAELPGPDQRASKNEQGPLILLVEDNQELREYLRDHLMTSYRIMEAVNGIEAYASAKNNSPDLIISDVMMPEMDGLELSRNLKGDILTSHIPVILLTARAPIEHQILGAETGADDYITKPFNLKLLELKISNLLLNRAKVREKFKSKISIRPADFVPVTPDDILIKKLYDLIELELTDPGLDSENICNTLGLSRTQLYRKLKAITGMSISEVIRDYRLKKAAMIIIDRSFTISEVSYMVGFTDPNHFGKAFKAQFGMTPSEYAKKGGII